MYGFAGLTVTSGVLNSYSAHREVSQQVSLVNGSPASSFEREEHRSTEQHKSLFTQRTFHDMKPVAPEMAPMTMNVIGAISGTLRRSRR